MFGNHNRIFGEIRRSGFYRVDQYGNVWTRRKRGDRKFKSLGRWRIVCRSNTTIGIKHGSYLGFKWRNHGVCAHTFVYWWFNGDTPDNMEVDHKDNNILNNNPSNLELVTKSENNRRRWLRRPELRSQHRNIFLGRKFSIKTLERMRIAARRRVKTNPPKPPILYGENNPRSVLTAEKVRMVRVEYENGGSRADIARCFGVSWTTIDRIVRLQRWRHV